MDYKITLKESSSKVSVYIEYLNISSNIDMRRKCSELSRILYSHNLLNKEVGFKISVVDCIEISINTKMELVAYLPGKSDLFSRSNGKFKDDIDYNCEYGILNINGIRFELDILKNILEELDYFLNYIFKVIEWELGYFNLNSYIKHRYMLLDKYKSKVKVKFNNKYLEINKFRYVGKDRLVIKNILVEKIKQGGLNLDNYSDLLEYFNKASILPIIIETKNVKKINEYLIESIREFEEQREFEYECE